MKKVLLVGAGYSARAFAAMAKPLGVEVAGTTRSKEKFDRLRAAGIRPIAFDGKRPLPHSDAPKLGEHTSEIFG